MRSLCHVYKHTAYSIAYVTLQSEENCDLCATFYIPTTYPSAYVTLQWEECCNLCAMCINIQPIPMHTLLYKTRRVAIFVPRVYTYNISPCIRNFTIRRGLRSLCNVYKPTSYHGAYVNNPTKYPRAYVTLQWEELCDLCATCITQPTIPVHTLLFNQRWVANIVPS